MIIRPRNWKSFQHYKSRRPAWIKLHRDLLDNYEYHCLPDASAALAPLLWLIASESGDGSIDADPKKLAFRLRKTPEQITAALKPLIESSFFEVLHVASGPLADGKQNGVSEERRGETEKDPSAAAQPAKKVSRETLETGDWFLDFKLAYPDRAGSQPWNRARRAANARFAEGHTQLELVRGAVKYAAYCAAAGKLNTEFVMQAATFLGPDKPFLQAWDPPAAPKSPDLVKREAADKALLVELRQRAAKIGFRDFIPGTDFVGGYEVLVKRAEDADREKRRLQSKGPKSAAEILGGRA